LQNHANVIIQLIVINTWINMYGCSDNVAVVPLLLLWQMNIPHFYRIQQCGFLTGSLVVAGTSTSQGMKE
jgi:hypothetical protein